MNRFFIDTERARLYRRMESAPYPRNLARVEGETLFHKPTLLVCGGLMTNDLSEDGFRSISAYSAVGHGALHYAPQFGAAPADIDILTVAYPYKEGRLTDGHEAYLRSLNATTAGAARRYEGYVERFAETYLYPLIENAQGKPLPIAAMKQNLRNIEILAHSYGATFAQQLGDLLYDRLEKDGLSQDDIRAVTSQILLVTAGPIGPLATGKASFTRIDIANLDDVSIANSYAFQESMKKLLGNNGLLIDRSADPVASFESRNHSEYFPAKPLNILPIARHGDELVRDSESRNYLVLASQPIVINTLGDVIQRPAIKSMNRLSSGGDASRWPKRVEYDNSHHQLPIYLKYGVADKEGPLEQAEHGITLRMAASCALINGMNNALKNGGKDDEGFIPLPVPQELLQLPKSMDYATDTKKSFYWLAEVDKYNDKIRAGISPQTEPGSYLRL